MGRAGGAGEGRAKGGGLCVRHDVRCAMPLPAHANLLPCAHPAPPADVDDPALEPIPVPKLDALPWAVRWMCAGTVEASGMVGALAGAADAGGLFGALEVRALAAARREEGGR